MGVFSVTILSSLLTYVFVAIVEGGCPNIISRSAWRARNGTSDPLVINPPTYVIIHHSSTDGCSTKDRCSALVRSFQNYHMNDRKWNDIGYNFLVGEDGNVYEGRGWGRTGAHAPQYNDRSIGICIIGTFNSKTPNAVAIDAVKDIIDCGVSQGKIIANYKLLGHRQVRDTDCPGNSLFEEIKKWKNWTPSP